MSSPEVSSMAHTSPHGAPQWFKEDSTGKVGSVTTRIGVTLVIKKYTPRGFLLYLKEMRLLQKIDAQYRSVPPFFVAIHRNFRLSTQPSIFMEYCSGGDLRQWRRSLIENGRPQFPEKMIWNCYSNLVSALHFLKYGLTGRPAADPEGPSRWNQIFHRDIKPDNVLVRLYGNHRPPDYVLCDFGAAVETNGIGWHEMLQDPHRYAGTVEWWAPEQCTSDLEFAERKFFPFVSEEADVWGVGAVVHFLALGRGPMAHKLDINYPPGLLHNKELSMRVPRAPTFIDAISTGSLGTAGTEPAMPIYSRTLNCKMMEALTFDPKKRTTVDRMHAVWPEGVENLKPFRVAHPVHGQTLAVRPSPWPEGVENVKPLRVPHPVHGHTLAARRSPPRRHPAVMANNNLLWEVESTFGPAWAMDYEGVPFDLGRCLRKKEELQTEKDSGKRRHSFGDWIDSKRAPHGIEDRKNYRAIEERIASFEKREENRIRFSKMAFRRKLWREGLHGRLNRLMQRIARRTGIPLDAVTRQYGADCTLPGMSFEELELYMRVPTPEEDREDDQQPAESKRKRSPDNVSSNTDGLSSANEADFLGLSDISDVSSGGSGQLPQTKDEEEWASRAKSIMGPGRRRKRPKHVESEGDAQSRTLSPGNIMPPAPTHERSKHVETEGYVQHRILCHLCDCEAVDQRVLDAHMSKSHLASAQEEQPHVKGKGIAKGKEAIRECTICGFITLSPDALAEHHLQHHFPSRDEPPVGVPEQLESEAMATTEGTVRVAEGEESISSDEGLYSPPTPTLQQPPHPEAEGSPRAEASGTAHARGQASAGAGDIEMEDVAMNAADRTDSGSGGRPQLSSNQWWAFGGHNH